MEEKLQQPRYYLPSIKKMRLLMMMGAILYTYGVYAGLSDLNGVIFGFSFPALYIISGYVVLWESPDLEKRILRAIKRAAICFVILFAVFFAMSLFVNKIGTLAIVSKKSFWINFLVFNVCDLPIGSTIWYVQALLYAYIIIYVIYKCKLLKFDIYIAAFCLVITMLTGELASVIGFDLFGKTYIGGNFLTRALPYILIGSFIQRKENFFFYGLDFLKNLVIFFVGIVLTIVEYYAITSTGNNVYVGHLFGMGVVAVGFCLFCFFVDGMRIRSSLLMSLTRYEIMIPFFICSPVYYLVVSLVARDEEWIYYLGEYLGVLTLLLSVAILYIYAFLRFLIFYLLHRKDEKNIDEPVE